MQAEGTEAACTLRHGPGGVRSGMGFYPVSSEVVSLSHGRCGETQVSWVRDDGLQCPHGPAMHSKGDALPLLPGGSGKLYCTGRGWGGRPSKGRNQVTWELEDTERIPPAPDQSPCVSREACLWLHPRLPPARLRIPRRARCRRPVGPGENPPPCLLACEASLTAVSLPFSTLCLATAGSGGVRTAWEEHVAAALTGATLTSSTPTDDRHAPRPAVQLATALGKPLAHAACALLGAALSLLANLPCCNRALLIYYHGNGAQPCAFILDSGSPSPSISVSGLRGGTGPGLGDPPGPVVV